MDGCAVKIFDGARGRKTALIIVPRAIADNDIVITVGFCVDI